MLLLFFYFFHQLFFRLSKFCLSLLVYGRRSQRGYLPMEEKSTGLFAHGRESRVRLGAECRLSCIQFYILFVYLSHFEWLEKERLTTRGCRVKIESWLNLLICLYKQVRVLRVGVYREISVAVISWSYRSSLCWCRWFRVVD